jgi:NADPH:quinone reductase
VKAWTVAATGPVPEALHLTDRPALRPGPGELVVRVEACGLNFSDLLLCQGRYQERPPLPFTPGTEIAGVVTGVGSGCRHRRGDRVVGRALLPDGGLAEEARMLDARALPLAPAMDPIDAAAMHLTFQTAWFGLHHRARLQAGEVVLVHAGAGGTGSAAVQVAVAGGATVVATAGGPEKVEVCRRLGARWALDHRRDDIRAEVLEVTEGRGVDVVFDTVGGASLDVARRCVAFEGRIVLVGFASGDHPMLPATHIFVKNYSVLGLQWPLYETRRTALVAEVHRRLGELYEQGRLRPLVHDVVGLEAAAEALVALGAGATTGKVVVRPGQSGTRGSPRASSTSK